MRMFLISLLILLTGTVIMPQASFAQEAMPDFDDPLPLPPPPVDDAPALPPPVSGNAGNVVTALPPLGKVEEVTAPASLPLSIDGATTAAINTDTQKTPDTPETPRPAKIMGGRVNVRAGPNTQYESVAVLTTGAQITVLAKAGEWLKIMFPDDQLVSIHKNYVDAQIAGEIPETGVAGTVKQDNAEVRAFYWDKSTIVGTVNKGDPVTIKQERGQWYRILPPVSARAYVFAEYVKIDSNEPLPADKSPAPENPNIDLSATKTDATAGNIKLSENDKKVSALKEQYFGRLIQREKVEEENINQQANAITEALDNLEARLREIDNQTQSSITYPVNTTTVGSSAWNAPDPMYGGYTGWLENIGRLGGAPSSFRLIKGGEIRFYLRSLQFNLEEYVGKRVWVNGNVELASGASANVLNIDQLRVLTDAENQTIGSGQTQSQPVAENIITDQATYIETYVTPTAESAVPVNPNTLPEYVGSASGSSALEPLSNTGIETIPSAIGDNSVSPGTSGVDFDFNTDEGPLMIDMD